MEVALIEGRMLKQILSSLISIVITTIGHLQYTRQCIFAGFRLVGKSKLVFRQIFYTF